MTFTITLEDMEFKAYHGCYDLEKVVGNRFLVTLSMEAQLEDAARADDVNKTINYLSVYRLVEEQMAIKSDIIENVAVRIVDSLYLTFDQLVKVSVTVSKIAPPLGGKIKKVSVTHTR